MYITSLDTAPGKDLRTRSGKSLQLIGPAEGCASLKMQVNLLQPGTGPGPYHYHSNADNIYLVLSGTGTIIVDGESHEVRPGDAMLISPGERHSVTATGTEEFRIVEIKTPADSDFIPVGDESRTTQPAPPA